MPNAPTHIPNPLILKPKVFGDTRRFFFERGLVELA
jgi:dTDP-4-dehydrorhamnose 3,5-epimerase-like enzyme